MDILAHGLWAAIGAKALNKALARNGKQARVNPWWTGFWGVFPDLLAFTPLVLFIVWNAVFGDATLGNFRSIAPDAYLNPIQYALRSLTGILYPLGHSMVTWAVAFGIVWLILRRPAWELLGWLSHVIIDIGTHPTEFYPTPFLWPVSELRLDGTAWATPTFLVINYALLFALLFFLRERHTVRESFLAMTNTKKILLGLLAVIAIVGAWTTFNRRAADNAPPSEPAPVTESPMAIQVFFSNDVFDPGIMECNRTYPVTRTIAKTLSVGRAALDELLKGPTSEEKADGYLTSLNDGVRINSLTITDGVAHVDFDARLEENAGGSCRVAAIRSQIANTLKQFPTVNEVIIGVEGRVEDALQP
jgi:hypothetical protein